MPYTAKNFLVCPYPFVCDVYKGCTHRCKYCFANAFKDEDKRSSFQSIKHGESIDAVEKFIKGGRSARDSWCDWDTPIQFGATSDAFQPIEKTEGRMLAVLKLLARTGYPFIVTTKGADVISSPEYLAVLKDCNVCVQISMSSPKMDVMEPGAPPFARRLAALEAVAKRVPRAIARMQPFFVEHTPDIVKAIPAIAAAGAFGILVEPVWGTARRLSPLQIKDGAKWLYRYEDVRKSFIAFRHACHTHGIAFVGNEVRDLSDAPVLCCTCGPMDGFVPNRCIAPYYYLERSSYSATERQCQVGTGDVFNNLFMPLELGHRKKYSFKQLMDYAVTHDFDRGDFA